MGPQVCSICLPLLIAALPMLQSPQRQLSRTPFLLAGSPHDGASASAAIPAAAAGTTPHAGSDAWPHAGTHVRPDAGPDAGADDGPHAEPDARADAWPGTATSSAAAAAASAAGYGCSASPQSAVCPASCVRSVTNALRLSRSLGCYKQRRSVVRSSTACLHVIQIQGLPYCFAWAASKLLYRSRSASSGSLQLASLLPPPARLSSSWTYEYHVLHAGYLRMPSPAGSSCGPAPRCSTKQHCRQQLDPLVQVACLREPALPSLDCPSCPHTCWASWGRCPPASSLRSSSSWPCRWPGSRWAGLGLFNQ